MTEPSEKEACQLPKCDDLAKEVGRISFHMFRCQDQGEHHQMFVTYEMANTLHEAAIVLAYVAALTEHKQEKE